MAHHIYTHHLSPFLVSWTVHGQTVGIRWYGLAYVFGFLLALWYFHRAEQEKKIPGFTPEALEQLIFAVVLGVLIGGRLGFVLQHTHELVADPMFAIRVWEGGMAFFGGLAGVVLAILWVAKRRGMPILAVLDVATFPAALALGVGRIANFVNGELVGRPTNGTWGVIFPGVDFVPRHPSQLYEAASHFLLFGLLCLAHRFLPGWSEGRGRLSALFLAGYGFLRFITDFFRQDDWIIGPFSAGQWVSLIIGAIGLLWLAWLYRRHPVERAR